MAAFLLISLISIAPGITSAQEELTLDINVPDEATVGEEITVDVSVTLPNLVGSYESDLSITLSVDDQEITTKTVTVEDGETVTVSFGHSFDSAGTHTVEVEAGISLAGQSFGDSVSTDIDVSEVETAVPTDTPSDASPTGISVEGASFAVPESLKDEIESYRERSPVDLGTHAFVLATTDDLYLVFTDREPEAGMATVEGISPDSELSAQGLTFSVVAASTAAFVTDGAQATVREVTANPEEYELELVRLEATHRRVTSLTDPDQGDDFTAASSSGVLVEDPQTANDMFDRPGEGALSFSVNASTEDRGGNAQAEVNAILDYDQPRLYTFGFRTGFWKDAVSTVDGIVLLPGSAAREFVSTFDTAGITRAESDDPVLYVVDDDLDPKAYGEVSDLKQQATDGDLVAIEAPLFGVTFSVQESIEHSTSCGEDLAQIPTPGGPICANLIQDSLLHTGVVWSSLPESKDEVLFVAGLSSRHLDDPTEPVHGRYQIVGEVVSTNRFDETLPEGKVLLVYELERTGDVDYAALGDEGQVIIEGRFRQLKDSAESQLTGLRTVNTSEITTDAGTGESSRANTTDEPDQQDGEATPAGSTQSSVADTGDGGILSDLSNLLDDLTEALSDIPDVLDSIFDAFDNIL